MFILHAGVRQFAAAIGLPDREKRQDAEDTSSINDVSLYRDHISMLIATLHGACIYGIRSMVIIYYTTASEL